MDGELLQRSWLKYFTKYTSCFEGYTTGNAQLQSLLQTYEIETYSHFVQVRSRGNYGKAYDELKEIPSKIRWTDPMVGTEPKIHSDGIPFIAMGTRSMACQYGPSKSKLKEPQNIPSDQVENRNCDQQTKKKRVGRYTSKKGLCPCVIKLRHIIKFPEYKLSHKHEDLCSCTNAICNLDLNLVARKLSTNLVDGVAVKMEHWFYVQLPDPLDHAIHLREWSAVQSVQSKLEKINSLTNQCTDKIILKKYEEILTNIYNSFSEDIRNSRGKTKGRKQNTHVKKHKKESISEAIEMPIEHVAPMTIETTGSSRIDMMNVAPNMDYCYETEMNITNPTMNVHNEHLYAQPMFGNNMHPTAIPYQNNALEQQSHLNVAYEPVSRPTNC